MLSSMSYQKVNEISHLGITTQKEYPYVPMKRPCQTDGGAFKITGYTDIRNCNTLANTIMSRVVSVAVDASKWSRYASGVFENCDKKLNHGVTLVGVKNGSWWVKNSWGNGWGEKGFIRLASGNTCGICQQSSFPQ